MTSQDASPAHSLSMGVDDVVEEAAAAVRLLVEARNKNAETSSTLADMMERLKESYTSLGRDYEELQAEHAIVKSERDQAQSERDAAVADVKKLIRAFQIFVNATSTAGAEMMSQDDRVKALMGLYKSIGRYGAPEGLPATAPVHAAPVAAVEPKPAVSVRPLVQPVPAPAPVEPPRAIEDEISSVLESEKARPRREETEVVPMDERRRTSHRQEPKIPGFLTRARESRETPILDEDVSASRSAAASGFGLFGARRANA